MSITQDLHRVVVEGDKVQVYFKDTLVIETTCGITGILKELLDQAYGQGYKEGFQEAYVKTIAFMNGIPT